MVVSTPTPRRIQQVIPLDLYSPGLLGPAAAGLPDGNVFELKFDRRCRSNLAVDVPAGESVYYTIR